jgi:hypothetical protein
MFMSKKNKRTSTKKSDGKLTDDQIWCSIILNLYTDSTFNFSFPICKYKGITCGEMGIILSRISLVADTGFVRLSPPTVLELRSYSFNILYDVYTHNGGVHVHRILILITVSGNVFLYYAITYLVICKLSITFFCTRSFVLFWHKHVSQQ